MNSYFDAQSGLKKLFVGTVGSLVCSVFSQIPVLGMATAVGSLLFTVLAVYGLYQAGNDIEGCKRAFVLYVVEFVIQLLEAAFAFMTIAAAVSTVCGIVQALLDMTIIYLVCTSVSEVLIKKNYIDEAKSGKTVWMITVIAYIIGIVATLIGIIPVLGIIAVPIAFIVAIAKIVAGILYLIFIYKSSQALA